MDYEASITEYVEGLDPASLGLTERHRVKELSQLELGEANLNFVLRLGGKKYVFRIGMDQASKWRTRMEFESLSMLQKYGICPKGFFLDESEKVFDRPISILEYVEGETLKSSAETDFIPENAVTKLAGLVGRIHSLELKNKLEGLRIRGTTYENWVEANRKNIEFVKKRMPVGVTEEVPLVKVIEEGISRAERFARQTGPTNVATPGHGDVCAQNIVMERGSGRLRLIDWENFGLWDPAAEIALIFEGFGLDFRPSQEHKFLEYYTGLREDKTLVERLKAFRPLLRLEQLTWGVKHVVEITRGEMDSEFVGRTDMKKHLDFISECLQKCSIAHDIVADRDEVKHLIVPLRRMARRQTR